MADTPTPAPKPTPASDDKSAAKTDTKSSRTGSADTHGLSDPIAPYAPSTNQVEGVDIAIARDGSGAQQVEPYADEYPADAKVEPALSQVNTRNQQAVGPPIGTGYTPPPPPEEIPALASFYAGAEATEESRQKAIHDTLEAFEDHGSKRTRAAGIPEDDLPVPNRHAS